MSDHHPSCRESDKDLVWLCGQCGEVESAADVEEVLDLTRKKLSQVQDAEAQQAHEIKRLKDMISQYAIAAHEH